MFRLFVWCHKTSILHALNRKILLTCIVCATFSFGASRKAKLSFRGLIFSYYLQQRCKFSTRKSCSRKGEKDIPCILNTCTVRNKSLEIFSSVHVMLISFRTPDSTCGFKLSNASVCICLKSPRWVNWLTLTSKQTFWCIVWRSSLGCWFERGKYFLVLRNEFWVH